MADRHILFAARELTPVMQGNLSRLCGLYSLINASQLILHPQRLSMAELQALYLHGIRGLSRRRQLNRVVGVGMHEALWLALAGDVFEWVNDAYGTAIKLKPLLPRGGQHNRARALDRLRKSIHGAGPVLASLGGALGHYTVICGYTEQRLLFFDSSGLRWIAADNLGVGETSRRRHWVTHAGLVSVIDDW